MLRIALALVRQWYHSFKRGPHQAIALDHGYKFFFIYVTLKYKWIGCICGKCFYKGNLTVEDTKLLCVALEIGKKLANVRPDDNTKIEIRIKG